MSIQIFAQNTGQEFVDFKNALQNFNGLIVCAAGNDGSDNDDLTDIYPMSSNTSNVLVVGANVFEDVEHVKALVKKYNDLAKNDVT